MTPIFQELHRWMGLRFIWGETDCMLVLADWIWRVRGVDPAAHVRGMYDSALSCERATGFIRRPVEAVDRCLDTIGGLPKVDVPVVGDIAVIVSPDPGGTFSAKGALWMGTAWAVKGVDGTTTVSPRMVQKVLAVWEVGYAA
jgi:hypothetical protein